MDEIDLMPEPWRGVASRFRNDPREIGAVTIECRDPPFRDRIRVEFANDRRRELLR